MLSRSTNSLKQTLKTSQYSSQKLINFTKRSYTVNSTMDGSVGSSRGSNNEDSFTKREKANEDIYIKQHEREQLLHLKEQIERHKNELKELENKIDKISKSSDT